MSFSIKANIVTLGNLNQTSSSFNASLLANTPITGNLINTVDTGKALVWNGNNWDSGSALSPGPSGNVVVQGNFIPDEPCTLTLGNTASPFESIYLCNTGGVIFEENRITVEESNVKISGPTGSGISVQKILGYSQGLGPTISTTNPNVGGLFIMGNDMGGTLGLTGDFFSVSKEEIFTVTYSQPYPNNSFPILFPINRTVDIINDGDFFYSNTGFGFSVGALEENIEYQFNYFISGN